MKKALLATALIAVIAFASCGGSPKATATGPDELDATIREAADYLNTRIPSGNKTAFINISGGYPDLSDYILSDLSKHAVNDGVFSVVDRAQLDAVRAELNFSWSGEVDDNSAQEIGKMLGAQTIVSGSVRKIGALYRLDIRAIAVQTAEVQGQWNKNIPNGATIAALTVTTSSGASVAGGTATGGRTSTGSGTASGSGGSGTQTVTPAQPPAPTYKIGDTGPAGGLIFYDKGNRSGGWQYLEAAPQSTEVRRKFLSGSTNPIRFDRINGIDEASTSEELGRGKENTEYLLERILNLGQWETAVQYCDDLVCGGFDDWFLPSLRELSFMYGNLVRREIGDFRQEFYWSSTAINRSGGGSITLNQRVVNMRDNAIEYRGGNDVSQQLYVRAARRF